MERDKIFLYNMSPLLGYFTFENKTQLNLYSLVTEQSMATVQTTSAIRKFQTSQNNTSYKLTIL